ncbi:MAG: hypothetical protein GY868_19190 [Deltaproteobacteria bacterium]|nr:hypothetical protein [Deltaproteobacteria bacterium]
MMLQKKSTWLALPLIVCMAVLLCAGAAAGALNEQYLSVVAGADGLTLSYDLASFGSEDVTVFPGQGSRSIPVFKNIITLDIEVTEVIEQASTLKLQAALTVLGIGEVFRLPLSLPFLELSLSREPNALSFEPVAEDTDVGLSLLYTGTSFQYDMRLDLLGLLSGQWQGEASRRSSLIAEEIEIDLSELPDTGDQFPGQVRIDLRLLPVLALGDISFVGVGLDLYQDDTRRISLPDDIPVLGSIIPLVPVPLAKGRYQIKIDLGFETVNQFILWLLENIKGQTRPPQEPDAGQPGSEHPGGFQP